MSDAYLQTGDGGRFRIDAGQRHAFECSCCGTVHMMAFESDPQIEGLAVIVSIGSDPREAGRPRGMVAAIRGSVHRLSARWNRSA